MNIRKLVCILSAAASTAVMAGYTTLTAFAEEADAASDQAAQQPVASLGGMFIPLIGMFVILYFIAIRPQKKRDRELKEMQENLQVGDEVVTGGGIVGIVVSVGEDTVVIETGGAKHKLRIKNWAITENVTAAERMKEAKAAGKSSSSSSSSSDSMESAALVDDDAEEKKSKKKKKDEEE
ncbi:MAG: preprotein translocase subunit YajC [Ruminococcus sp.]|uniref:preprotein translocase subunit YajC n=1 Tax=Ruminococcus sp. TaxID=41978 RepID=UPI001B1493FD|nr:preprotein translocase subunit YajC [Ruminococcus sp.]MBO7474902.1 preprotein translocase subunit YajC [Ruminococcus sp.]